MTNVARWAIIGSLFLIPLLPLYVSTSLFFPFITGKGFAFRILVEVALVAWGLLALIDTRYRPRFSWTLVIFGAFVLWMLIADLLGANPMKAIWSNYERMDGWVTLAHVFALFLVAGTFLSAERLWRKWWLMFVGASALVAGYGVLQVMGVLEIHQGGVRLDATMGNATYLAVYLLFVIGACVWLSIEARGWVRYALYLLAGIQGVLLYLTATRGAILGLVGGIMLALISWAILASGKPRKIAAAALAGIAILVGGFFLVRDADWVKEDPTLARFASISLSEGDTRLTLWGMALKGVSERPITGWGQDGFNYIFNTHYEPSLYAQEPWFDRAHNIYIDWLVAGGVPALLLFLGLLASAVLVFYRKGTRGERLILIPLLAAYAIQGLFVFDNLFSYVPLAMLLAVAHMRSSRPVTRIESFPVPSSQSFSTYALPIGGIVAATLVWFVNAQPLFAARDLITALTPQQDMRQNIVAVDRALARNSFGQQEIREQWMGFANRVAGNQSIPEDVRAAVVVRAAEQMQLQVEQVPNDARLRLLYAHSLRALGDYDAAHREIEMARMLSPRKQALIVEEGVTAWQQGDFNRARDAFNRAHELDPSFDDLLGYKAAGLIVTGETAEGERLLAEYIKRTGSVHNMAILAYYETKNYGKLVPILEERAQEAQELSSYLQLVNVLVEAGRVEDAKRTLRALINAFPQLSGQLLPMLTSLESAR